MFLLHPSRWLALERDVTQPIVAQSLSCVDLSSQARIKMTFYQKVLWASQEATLVKL